jgi:Ribonuclease G/E
MSKELVISANRHETKVAILEDDQLVEVFFQRANEYSLAGSIHKGRVTRVLPGMQSAFVDLGLDRDTFLYVSDFFEEETEDFDRVTPREEPRRQRENRPPVEVRAIEEPAPGAEPPTAPVEASVAPPSEGTTAPPRPNVPSGRPEDGDRDRHGRRGRRRRNRVMLRDRWKPLLRPLPFHRGQRRRQRMNQQPKMSLCSRCCQVNRWPSTRDPIFSR